MVLHEFSVASIDGANEFSNKFADEFEADVMFLVIDCGMPVNPVFLPEKPGVII